MHYYSYKPTYKCIIMQAAFGLGSYPFLEASIVTNENGVNAGESNSLHRGSWRSNLD